MLNGNANRMIDEPPDPSTDKNRSAFANKKSPSLEQALLSTLEIPANFAVNNDITEYTEKSHESTVEPNIIQALLTTSGISGSLAINKDITELMEEPQAYTKIEPNVESALLTTLGVPGSLAIHDDITELVEEPQTYAEIETNIQSALMATLGVPGSLAIHDDMTELVEEPEKYPEIDTNIQSALMATIGVPGSLAFHDDITELVEEVNIKEALLSSLIPGSLVVSDLVESIPESKEGLKLQTLEIPEVLDNELSEDQSSERITPIDVLDDIAKEVDRLAESRGMVNGYDEDKECLRILNPDDVSNETALTDLSDGDEPELQFEVRESESEEERLENDLGAVGDENNNVKVVNYELAEMLEKEEIMEEKEDTRDNAFLRPERSSPNLWELEEENNGWGVTSAAVDEVIIETRGESCNVSKEDNWSVDSTKDSDSSGKLGDSSASEVETNITELEGFSGSEMLEPSAFGSEGKDRQPIKETHEKKSSEGSQSIELEVNEELSDEVVAEQDSDQKNLAKSDDDGKSVDEEFVPENSSEAVSENAEKNDDEKDVDLATDNQSNDLDDDGGEGIELPLETEATNDDDTKTIESEETITRPETENIPIQAESIPEEDSINVNENVMVVNNGRVPILESPSESIEEVVRSATESIEEIVPSEHGFVVEYNFNPTDDPESEPFHQNDVGHISNDFSSVVYNMMPPGMGVMNSELHVNLDELATMSDDLSELSAFTESELNESGIPTGAMYIIDDGVTQRHVYIDRVTNSIVEIIPELQEEQPHSDHLGVEESEEYYERAGSPYPMEDRVQIKDQLHIPESVIETDSNAASDSEAVETLPRGVLSLGDSSDDVVLFDQRAPKNQIPSFDLRSVSQESEYDQNLPDAKQRENIPDFWNRTISSQNSSLDIPTSSNVSTQAHGGLNKQFTVTSKMTPRLSRTDSSVSVGSEVSFDDDGGVIQSSVNVQQKQLHHESSSEFVPTMQTHEEVEEDLVLKIPSITEDRVFDDVEMAQEGCTTPYNEEFLNSLDGLNFSPMTRDRRKTFKRRSRSSSSNSSIGSRNSRDEELKLLTSLEEVEQGVTYDQMEQRTTGGTSSDELKPESKRKRKHRNKKSIHSDKVAEIAIPENIVNLDDIDDESVEVEKAHALYAERRTMRQLTKVASFEDPNEVQKHKEEQEKIEQRPASTMDDVEKNKSGNAFWVIN